MTIGAPSAYTEEIAEEILRRMCEGESINSICKDPHIPARSTVMLWVATDREGFSDKYARAMEARAHFWAEEILDIADNASNDYIERNDPDNPGYITNGEAVSRSKLRVDSRKWMLSKLLPKFSDKQTIDHMSSDRSMTPKASLDVSKLSTSALAEILAAQDQSEK